MEPCSEAKVSMIAGGTQFAGALCFEHCSIKLTEDFIHVLTGKSEIIHRMNCAVHSQTSQSKMRRQNGYILLSVAQASNIGRLQAGLGRHGWCGAVVLGRAQRRNSEPNKVAIMMFLKISRTHKCRKSVPEIQSSIEMSCPIER